MLELHEVPAKIWNEIQNVSLNMEFIYEEEKQWRRVREVLQGLVAAIRERTIPLKRLKIKMEWTRVAEDSGSSMRRPHQKSSADIWHSMVEPLSMTQWGREGAEEVVFQGQDYWHGDADVQAGEEENGEKRVFRCNSFTDFEQGLKGAENGGRLHVEPWPIRGDEIWQCPDEM
jgi:hypothetical protein